MTNIEYTILNNKLKQIESIVEDVQQCLLDNTYMRVCMKRTWQRLDNVKDDIESMQEKIEQDYIILDEIRDTALATDENTCNGINIPEMPADATVKSQARENRHKCGNCVKFGNKNSDGTGFCCNAWLKEPGDTCADWKGKVVTP